ncbi:microtubule-associated protein futsch-like isoform x11 protein [Lasius niger]|uniref:Microtubule-associated protein futsch-like isoform x11 protein n=1 Tax=Lasius niger TaxID=67767 RepID=A0A0J7KXY2_LASNI|nr:microtubule-associated protein futsch-like isoform x11 protein [Lasius niger]
MTIHKKGAMSKTKNKGSAKNEVATTSSDVVTTTETVEVVSSTSVVEESRQVTESEIRSSTTEVTSTGREIVMDSKGNAIKVIETSPQTIQQSTSSHKIGKSSEDLIAGEQTQSIKQAKTTRETPREDAKSLSESHVVRGDSSDLINQSVQMQSQSESRSTAQQSVSSSTVIESSSTSEDHGGHRRSTVVDIRNGDHAPVIQASSRATENTRASSETCETVTKDGQTVSSRTRIRETGEKIDDNGREVSTSSREVDNERTIAPSKVTTVIKSVDDSVDKSARGADSKSASSNVEISTRCFKPGQSAWDGTFVHEKPLSPRGKNVIDKMVSVSSKVHGDARDSETSVKVTQETSATEEVIDRISSSSSTVIRDSKTVVGEGQPSATTRLLRDTASEKIAATDTTDFAGKERHSRGPVRRSKFGDSGWDGSFVVEKTRTQPRRRTTDSDVAETIERRDLREKSADGTYEKESSESVRVVKGATDSTRFISEERRDVSRESSTRIDDAPMPSREEHPARASSPSHRRIVRFGDSAWNGEFVYEKAEQDEKARKRSPADVTVVRRTEKHHDSVDVQDVTEEQNVSNVSESVSASYIVEYAISNDKKNVEKVTSVSEVILEEDGTEDRRTRGPGSPERQSKRDADSRCYKPGQSTWDGTFVYERPKTPDSRQKPEDKRTGKTIDIRDVTGDNSINEADVTSTSYVVEHSSSQQSFSDVRDASLTSTIYETVVYEGRPVEMTIRFDKDTPRSQASNVKERQPSPSPHLTSPEKMSKDRDLRSTKPGSSTWDGTFVLEKSQEKKRPPSRESTDGGPSEKSRPTDSKGTFVDTSKKHVSDTTIDLRNVTQDVSSTSEIVESSVIMEQSKTRETYADSSNLDFSTTSVETVIIRDGQPVTTQKTVTTIQEGPAKRAFADDVITDIKESTVKSPEKKKKEPRTDDRNYRPTKPGSSTWDGSFVYEKSEEKRKTPKDTRIEIDRRSPTKERPAEVTDHKTVTISDTLRDTTSAADYSTSSTTVEQTFVTDSKTYDISKTFIEVSTEDKVHEIDYEKPRQPIDEKPKPSPRQRPEDAKKPRDEEPRKSPGDRTYRPSKPGASTWDGSFVSEKPQDSRKKPTDDQAIEEPRKSPDEKPESIPISRKEPDERTPRRDVSETRYIEDVTDITREDITRTSEAVQRSSYVIDQSSSFTSVQDERVITDFTIDARKDVNECIVSRSKIETILNFDATDMRENTSIATF